MQDLIPDRTPNVRVDRSRPNLLARSTSRHDHPLDWFDDGLELFTKFLRRRVPSILGRGLDGSDSDEEYLGSGLAVVYAAIVEGSGMGMGRNYVSWSGGGSDSVARTGKSQLGSSTGNTSN